MPSFISDPKLRLLLFGGKGGVGKTTCASATALRLAEQYPGGSFLLLSTDPAHSLWDCMQGFRTPSNLDIIELDTPAMLRGFQNEHREKLKEIALRGTFLDEEDSENLVTLSLPGLDEVMALLDVSRWLESSRYQCIVVDTAPTGHTLRLLAMPHLMEQWLQALDTLLSKHRYMKAVFKGTFKADEIDRFVLDLFETLKNIQSVLRDASICRFVPVMVAEKLSIHETEMLLERLSDTAIAVEDVLVNKLVPSDNCAVCRSIYHIQQDALASLDTCKWFGQLKMCGIPLFSRELCHDQKLSETFWRQARPLETWEFPYIHPPKLLPGPDDDAAFDHPLAGFKLIVFGGKGGVGKSTLACAGALSLARSQPDKRFLLLSTDPAHSLSDCLGMVVGSYPKNVASNLWVQELNAQEAFQSLKEEYGTELEAFFENSFRNIDPTFDREVMQRIFDLSPPGVDEIMAISQSMEHLSSKYYDVLIVDSAPTGHFVKLLTLPELIEEWLHVIFGIFLKYHLVKQLPRVAERLVKFSKDLKFFRALLKSPDEATAVAVGIPSRMALAETIDFVSACQKIGIHISLLLMNMVTPKGDCPICMERHQIEQNIMEEFRLIFAGIQHVVVFRQDKPEGTEKLERLGMSIFRPFCHKK